MRSRVTSAEVCLGRAPPNLSGAYASRLFNRPELAVVTSLAQAYIAATEKRTASELQLSFLVEGDVGCVGVRISTTDSKPRTSVKTERTTAPLGHV